MKTTSSCVLGVFSFALLLSSLSFAQSFQRTILSSPNTPSDVFAVDLNHDGKLDLITTQDNTNLVTVFLNRGDGTFPDGGSATYLTGGIETSRVVAADFDGDGNMDIAALSCGASTNPGQEVSILFGNGDGTFKPHVDYHLVSTDPPTCEDSLGIVTLANTVRPSLIVSSFTSEIAILRNDGHGAFTQQTIVGPPFQVLSGVSATDYNGDHLQDIAAISRDASGSPSHIVIFYENPDGSFQQPVTIFTFSSFLQAANTVDFNGDGKGDLLIPFLQGVDNRAGVIALTNLGAGKFRSAVLTADAFYTFASRKASALHPTGNQAGLRGILAPLSPDSNAGHSVFAFFPAEGTSWGKPIYFDQPTGGSQASAGGDFNSDGRPDFAAADSAGKLYIFENTTTAATCAYPGVATVRICSPASNSTGSLVSKIHASASGGFLPIVAMKAYIDGTQVAESDLNTLDASVTTKAGKHTLTINAWDPNDKVYQSIVKFIAQ
jgi:hypothetical protein